jgi:hypothetical protein
MKSSLKTTEFENNPTSTNSTSKKTDSTPNIVVRIWRNMAGHRLGFFAIIFISIAIIVGLCIIGLNV